MASFKTTLIAFVSLALFAGAHTSTSEPFNPLHHSGPASPYFDAPAQFDISSDTPAQCKVEQAAYILRHGS